MNFSPRVQKQRGFIALISALVITAILMVLVFSVGTSSFFARFDSLGGENKRISLGLAESCVNVALMALATSTSPSTYSPVNQVVTIGTDSQGNPMNCTIQSITHNGSVATVDVQAQWQGAYSNVTARATIPDPSTGSVVPPPTCAITASPATVPQGQPVLLQWASSAGATSITIVGQGAPAGAQSPAGSYSLTAAGVGVVNYTATVSNGINTGQCTASYTVTAPPPSPACADTVMMLDRTGSLSSTDRANVKAAANTLVDLYAGVSTLPKVGAGSFGSLDNQHFASVPSPSGWLQNTYSSLKSTITAMVDNQASCTDVPSGKSCNTNVAAAVTAGYQELGSVRHTSGFKKVLIFVSDGQTNMPINDAGHAQDRDTALTESDSAKANGVEVFSVLYNSSGSQTQTDRTFMAQLATGDVTVPGHFKGSDDSSNVQTATGFLFPSFAHSPSNWSNPNNAFGIDSSYAADNTNLHQQGYSSFHFNIPAGSTINGIEATVRGLASAPSQNVTLVPSGNGNLNYWNQNSGTAANKFTMVTVNDGDATYISTSTVNGGQTFSFPGAGVPAGSTINSVTVGVVARSSSGASSIAIRAQDFVNPGNTYDGTPFTPAATYATTTQAFTTNPLTGSPWTAADVNSAVTRFGVVKVAGTGTVRVTHIYIVVNYAPAVTGSCDLGAELSWNNGTNYSSQLTFPLATTEAPITIGSPTSLSVWGAHSWVPGDFADTGASSFVMRLTNKTCSGALVASVNSIQVNVHYTGSDPNVENTDGDNFFITPSTNLASIQNIFDTIGRKVCPAAAARCANGVDDDGDGLTDSADPMCHIGGNIANPYDSNINDEYEHPAPPGPPTAPPPPPSVDLGSWQEIPQ